MSKIKYRPDIDGLRAIAVLPVMFFHAGFSSFSGGFVGVDVFFVISGYLITMVILTEKEQGTFSLINFYERRARRILPALFLVMLTCIPFAWFWFSPSDMKDFSQSLVAVSTFSSNILFWKESGYWGTSNELKPLLHTWSLAVEEQYYVLFPILLILIWQLQKRWVLGFFLAIFTASLLLAQYGVHNYPSATFLLLPTRGWELVIGACIAFYVLHRRNVTGKLLSNPLLSEMMSFLGVILIGYAVIAFDATTPFPGVYALIPTLGAGLIIIFSERDTYVAKCLGSKVFVSIGLISYSAYLWHQPLLAFARHRSIDEPSKLVMISFLVFATMISYFSWKYVETPFRKKQSFSRKEIVVYSTLGSIAFIIFGILGHLSNGFSNRSTPDHLPKNYFDMGSNKPFNNTGIYGNLCTSETASICRINIEESTKNILLVGDSHSADYSVVFRDYLNSKNVNGWQFSIGGCGFIDSQSKNKECRKAQLLLKKTLEENKFDMIIFIGDYYGYSRKSDKVSLKNDMDYLLGLVSHMRSSSREVILFTPRYSLSSMPIRAALLNKLNSIKVIKDIHMGYINKRFDDFKSLDNVKVFNERDYLVKLSSNEAEYFNGHTLMFEPLYRDTNHLTTYGSRLVFREVISAFDLNNI